MWPAPPSLLMLNQMRLMDPLRLLRVSILYILRKRLCFNFTIIAKDAQNEGIASAADFSAYIPLTFWRYGRISRQLWHFNMTIVRYELRTTGEMARMKLNFVLFYKNPEIHVLWWKGCINQLTALWILLTL